jgi:hypothetical protein
VPARQIVERQPPALDERHDRRRRERLADRSDLEGVSSWTASGFSTLVTP